MEEEVVEIKSKKTKTPIIIKKEKHTWQKLFSSFREITSSVDDYKKSTMPPLPFTSTFGQMFKSCHVRYHDFLSREDNKPDSHYTYEIASLIYVCSGTNGTIEEYLSEVSKDIALLISQIWNICMFDLDQDIKTFPFFNLKRAIILVLKYKGLLNNIRKQRLKSFIRIEDKNKEAEEVYKRYFISTDKEQLEKEKIELLEYDKFKRLFDERPEIIDWRLNYIVNELNVATKTREEKESLQNLKNELIKKKGRAVILDLTDPKIAKLPYIGSLSKYDVLELNKAHVDVLEARVKETIKELEDITKELSKITDKINNISLSMSPNGIQDIIKLTDAEIAEKEKQIQLYDIELRNLEKEQTKLYKEQNIIDKILTSREDTEREKYIDTMTTFKRDIRTITELYSFINEHKKLLSLVQKVAYISTLGVTDMTDCLDEFGNYIKYEIMGKYKSNNEIHLNLQDQFLSNAINACIVALAELESLYQNIEDDHLLLSDIDDTDDNRIVKKYNINITEIYDELMHIKVNFKLLKQITVTLNLDKNLKDIIQENIVLNRSNEFVEADILKMLKTTFLDKEELQFIELDYDEDDIKLIEDDGEITISPYKTDDETVEDNDIANDKNNQQGIDILDIYGVDEYKKIFSDAKKKAGKSDFQYGTNMTIDAFKDANRTLLMKLIPDDATVFDLATSFNNIDKVITDDKLSKKKYYPVNSLSIDPKDKPEKLGNVNDLEDDIIYKSGYGTMVDEHGDIYAVKNGYGTRHILRYINYDSELDMEVMVISVYDQTDFKEYSVNKPLFNVTPGFLVGIDKNTKAGKNVFHAPLLIDNKMSKYLTGLLLSEVKGKAVYAKYKKKIINNDDVETNDFEDNDDDDDDDDNKEEKYNDTSNNKPKEFIVKVEKEAVVHNYEDEGADPLLSEVSNINEIRLNILLKLKSKDVLITEPVNISPTIPLQLTNNNNNNNIKVKKRHNMVTHKDEYLVEDLTTGKVEIMDKDPRKK